ncbi:GNAT family N-acetyltransferase [Mesoterricola silvestris]|uniref:N-acetyltransferase domain-containing protein n=1 Tax=Mesoterricola silvestris TaxID=2927979 RepID=A0AA48GUD3_9BACT|nr:GNAT family N-acetyltransferase [Mesoterricola silvestris]BDU71956.1 hypothetical protein METEAL_11300 [Mesoterricola silvestris]
MTGSSRVGLRPCGPADAEFLFQVFYHTRAEEFAPAGWDEARLTGFLRDQSQLQERHYHAAHPEAAFEVVEVDGVPAGRQYLDRTGPVFQLIDIALLPAHRGQGIGGELLERILREADGLGRTVALHVEPDNPARLWYRRLGFREGGQVGIHVSMRREPVPGGTGHA